jgi:hypothetical protein
LFLFPSAAGRRPRETAAPDRLAWFISKINTIALSGSHLKKFSVSKGFASSAYEMTFRIRLDLSDWDFPGKTANTPPARKFPFKHFARD